MSTRTKGLRESSRSRASRGRARLGIRYVDDRILLTDNHAWAYYRIPSVSWEFTTPEEREALATNITVALAAIRMADAEVHLRIAHRSYPAHAWATGLDATSDGGPGWREYLEQAYEHVWSKDFWAKEIYLGVRLGQRGMRAQLSGGMLSQFISAYNRGERGLGLIDEAVSGAEISKWTDSAEPFGRVCPLGDLRPADRLVDEPEPTLAPVIRADELGQHPAGQLRPHAALAEPDTEVDLLGPEILGPDVLVGLFQVVPPARAPVRRRVQPGRPRVRRVRPVRDAQVNLGVGHPDRGQRDGDVRGQRLAFLRGGELPRDRRNPVVGPGMVVGEQDPVIEVPDA